MISKAEKKWLLLFSLLVMGLTTIPYVLGFALQGEEWRYTGFVFGVEDGNSYIAKMLSGAYGAWLFRTPYTALPQNGLFAFFLYLLLGKISLSGMRHTSLVVLFHSFRWIGGFLMIRATYDFAAIYLEDIKYRKVATSIATVGGGFGWLAITGLSALWENGLPLEFYSPESFGFLSIYGLPHLACARALLLFGFTKYLQSANSSWKTGLLTSGLWFVLGLMQPITVVVGGAVIGWHLLLSGLIAFIKQQGALKLRWKEQFGFAVRMALLPAPVVFYTGFSFLRDPFLSEWSAQNVIQSPPFRDYLLAYGGMLVLAGVGLKFVLRKGDKNAWLFLVGWVLLFPILAYAPFNVQRRLPEGVWVAITILGVAGISSFQRKFEGAAHVFVATAFLPALILLAGGITAVLNVSSPLYRPAQEIETFVWLRSNGLPNEVVLASYDTSNPLPAWTPMRTLVGHGPESIHLEEINARVKEFYQLETGDAVRIRLIEEFSVGYLIWGPEERALGNWSPDNANFLELRFQNEEYQIFKVVD